MAPKPPTAIGCKQPGLYTPLQEVSKWSVLMGDEQLLKCYPILFFSKCTETMFQQHVALSQLFLLPCELD